MHYQHRDRLVSTRGDTVRLTGIDIAVVSDDRRDFAINVVAVLVSLPSSSGSYACWAPRSVVDMPLRLVLLDVLYTGLRRVLREPYW